MAGLRDGLSRETEEKVVTTYSGARNPNWRGGRSIHSGGYVKLKMPEHPFADGNGYVLEHIVVAEKSFGRFLPRGAVVHHRNDVGSDNRPDNYVICHDQGYHMLLHMRRRAYRATGNPNSRTCVGCGEWLTPGQPGTSFGMGISKRHPNGRAYHRACVNGATAKRRRAA